MGHSGTYVAWGKGDVAPRCVALHYTASFSSSLLRRVGRRRLPLGKRGEVLPDWAAKKIIKIIKGTDHRRGLVAWRTVFYSGHGHQLLTNEKGEKQHWHYENPDLWRELFLLWMLLLQECFRRQRWLMLINKIFMKNVHLRLSSYHGLEINRNINSNLNFL